MNKAGMIALLWISMGLLGCGQLAPGSQQVLGEYDYAAAFSKAKDIFAQYYSIESADPVTGKIVSRPKYDTSPKNLYSTRELATLNIDNQGGIITAQLSITVERQTSAAARQMNLYRENYDEVPNKSPAYGEAATTAEQNQSWGFDRYNRALERRILQELILGINPAKAPATQPAK